MVRDFGTTPSSFLPRQLSFCPRFNFSPSFIPHRPHLKHKLTNLFSQCRRIENGYDPREEPATRRMDRAQPVGRRARRVRGARRDEPGGVCQHDVDRAVMIRRGDGLRCKKGSTIDRLAREVWRKCVCISSGFAHESQ